MADCVEILFLIPYHLTRPYFSSLYSDCEYHIATEYGEDYRVVWRCVTRLEDEFDAGKVVGALRKEWKQSDKIGLLVVTPTGSRELADGIVRSMTARTRGTIPTIAVSLPFQNREPFDANKLPFPPTVYCDSKDGGKQLAMAARDDFRRRWPTLPRPNVVLIPGEADRSDSDDRLSSFEAELADLKPVVTRLAPCLWQRDPAKTAMLEHIRGATAEVHIVFAACDEMALGARDAARAGPTETAGRALIYGYDAVSEVRSLIDERDLNMMATVRQSSDAMARGLADMIPLVLKVPGTPPPDILIKPDIVRSAGPETFEELLARILPVNSASEKWLSVTKAAKYTGLKAGTLKDYRKPSRDPEVCDVLRHHCGRDSLGRIWCRLGDGAPYYWKDSLIEKQTNREPVPEGTGGD